MILAVETSCDDTCAAVVDRAGRVRSNAISSQEVHDRFGGVVPEIASRHHLELVNLVVDRALAQAGAELDDVELVAATQGPGLIGALLVGLSAAKGLAAARELPFAPVDHIQGHVAANFLRVRADGDAPAAPAGAGAGATGAGDGPPSEEPFEPPFVCLIASGGHTLVAEVRDREGFRTLGRTLDDAAGEAFDKGARMLGLGFPGGPALDRLAREGDPHAFRFPASGSRSPAGRRSRRSATGGRGSARPFARSLDFSFAGLKTSLLYRLRELGGVEGADSQRVRACAADLAASYQSAIVDHLMLRAGQALELTGLDRLAVGGGVAANGELRRRLRALGVAVHVPPRELCTDNAAMIASAARFVPALPYPQYLDLDAYATGERPTAGAR